MNVIEAVCIAAFVVVVIVVAYAFISDVVEDNKAGRGGIVSRFWYRLLERLTGGGGD